MRRILRYSMLAVIAAVLTVATAMFIPQRVDDQTGLSVVRCGYPVAFITQDFSRLDPPSFPQFYGCGPSLEDPCAISWPAFSLSWLMVFIAVLGVYTAFQRLIRK